MTGLEQALQDVANTGARRGHHDVYRFAMSALGFILVDPQRHKSMAEAVLDGCRHYLARSRA